MNWFDADYSPAILIGWLNRLAHKSENGFISFTDYCKASNRETYDDYVIYDEKTRKIPLDVVVDTAHNDIVSYYELPDVKITVIEDEDEDDHFFIDVITPQGNFVVEDGCWYVSGVSI